MKLTKRLKKFKLRKNLDDTNHNIQCFVSKDGLVRHEYAHMCFGRTVDSYRVNDTASHNSEHESNPITTLEVWQSDNLSNAFLNTEVSDRVLSIMGSWGLFRNCTVERVLSKDVTFSNNLALRIKNNSKHLLKISFNFKTIKPQEVWLVGWVVRHLSCHPIVMLSFLKVLKRHPEIPSWQLFLASFSVKFARKDIEIYEGHLLTVRSNLALIKDVSIQDVLNDIDSRNYTTILKSNSYNITGGIANRFSQMVSSQPMLAVCKITGREKFTYRNNAEPYSKGLIESFFSGAKFKERYIKDKFTEKNKDAFNFVR